MKNKEVAKFLGLVFISSAVTTGCTYNPAAENVMLDYGVVVMDTLPDEGTIELNEDISEIDRTSDIEYKSSEESKELKERIEELTEGLEVDAVCLYGPAPTPLERAINKVKNIFN